MDNEDWLKLSLWVHVPFVVTWFGFVMLDVFAAFAPGVDDRQRLRMIGWSRLFVIVAIPTIFATGVWQTIENPFFRVESFSGLSELRDRTLYGDLLFWKHVFVIATFGLTLLVRFVLAPRLMAGVAADGGGAAGVLVASLRQVQLLSLLNLGANLAAILLATRMVAELH